MLIMRFAHVQWLAPLSLHYMLTAHYKCQVIIIIMILIHSNLTLMITKLTTYCYTSLVCALRMWLQAWPSSFSSCFSCPCSITSTTLSCTASTPLSSVYWFLSARALRIRLRCQATPRVGTRLSSWPLAPAFPSDTGLAIRKISLMQLMFYLFIIFTKFYTFGRYITVYESW